MNSDFPTDNGVLLVGHGTRDACGQAEFLQTADLLREALPDIPIEACFLELADPDIPTGVRAIAEAGVRRFIAAPLLLFTAGHAKRDIPDAIAAAAKDYQDLSWQMAMPLEDHPALLDLSAHRYRQALAADEVSPHDISLLFVGRGSSDAEAIDKVHHFARQRVQRTPAGKYQVCFLAAARPTLDEAMEWAAAQTATHVVVQPHLLFRGKLIDTIAARIADALASANGSVKSWHIAQHLGPAPDVVAALRDRVLQALREMSC